MAERIIIGLGTGRCGTMSLAKLLAMQPDTEATHELMPLPPWEPCYREVWCLLGWMFARGPHVAADVAWSWCPYVPWILSIFPTTKFVCLRRDKASCVSSMLRKAVHINQFQHHNGRKWMWMPVVDRAMPKYDDEPTRERAAERFWEEYNAIAERYQTSYPDNFRIFPMEDLNRLDGVERILRFAGYDAPLVVAGLKANQSPPLTS